jgi:hypothetical protein
MPVEERAAGGRTAAKTEAADVRLVPYLDANVVTRIELPGVSRHRIAFEPLSGGRAHIRAAKM